MKPQHCWRPLVLALLLTGCSHAPTTPTAPIEDPGVSSSGDVVDPISQAYAWPNALPKTASIAQVQCLHHVSGSGTTGIGNKRVAFILASSIAAGSTGSPVELGTLKVTAEETGTVYDGVVTETTRANNALILKGKLTDDAQATFNAVLLTKNADSVPYGFVFAIKDGSRDLAFGSVKPIDSGEFKIGLCEGAL